MLRLFCSGLLLFFSLTVCGQYSLSTPTYPVQSFDNLGTATSTVALGNLNNLNTSLNGWYFLETGSANNTTITAGDGSMNTGDSYNFGSTSASDRSLGGLRSGSLAPIFGFYFTNNTGSTITSLTITYTGEQWRLGATGRLDSLHFEYSTNSTGITGGSWTRYSPLDYSAPNSTGTPGALDGNNPANRVTVSSTIFGLNVAVGSTIAIRWSDFDASGADDGLSIDDFSLAVGNAIPLINYFRSAASGNWSSLSTWETSSDGSTNWVAASSIPTSSSNTITIRSPHTVTVNADASADELIIQNGATLHHTSGSFVINDGAGTDVDVQSGGILNLGYSNSGNALQFNGSSVVNISTGATLRLSTTGATGSGFGVNANNYVYQHQSVLEYTPNLSFSSSNVTFFPNVTASTIPIFRTTNTSSIAVGATTNTVINGIFECNGATVYWQNTGTKTFRNGIRGTGTVDGQNAGTPSGTFIINGTTAQLGGTGSLVLPTASGMSISSGSTVSMISNKTVTGNIALNSNSYIDLGTYDLTVSGTISGGSSTSYIRTSGTGALTLNSVTSKTFPVGNSSYNPLTISNGSGLNYTVRVQTGMSSAVPVPSYAVYRTWHIKSSSVASGVILGFQYAAADASAGALPQPTSMEILAHLANVNSHPSGWNILNDNLMPSGSDPYLVTSNVSGGITIPANATEFVLGKSGGWVLPLDFFISAKAQKQQGSAFISWQTFSNDNVVSFEVQRSVNGNGFVTIDSIAPINNQFVYSITDRHLQNGINRYRIKVNRMAGSERYSNTVAVVHESKAVVFNGIIPNPVISTAVVGMSAAAPTPVLLTLTDMSGRILRQWNKTISGTSNIELDFSGLSAGVYHLSALVQGMPVQQLRFVKQ